MKNTTRAWFPPLVRVECRVEVSARQEQTPDVSEAMRGLLKDKSPLEIMSENWFVSYMETGPKKKTLMDVASVHILLSTFWVVSGAVVVVSFCLSLSLSIFFLLHPLPLILSFSPPPPSTDNSLFERKKLRSQVLRPLLQRHQERSHRQGCCQDWLWFIQHRAYPSVAR